MTTSNDLDFEIPPECVLLKDAYRRSRLTAADIAAAAGMSLATAHITMSGMRYRKGEPKKAIPPDSTLIKFASVLRIPSDKLREVGRTRAADLLDEAYASTPREAARALTEKEAQAAVSGRAALAKQVLALFSTEELRQELQRREADDAAEDAEEVEREIREAAMEEIADLSGR